MKKYFKSGGYAKRQSTDIRRQDESAGTDNQRIVKHRERKIFVFPGAQDTPCYATGYWGPTSRELRQKYIESWNRPVKSETLI